MPHIIVKLGAGRSEQEKFELAEALANAAIATLAIDPTTISVGIDDVQPENWVADIYKPEILGKSDRIYRDPGYDPL